MSAANRVLYLRIALIVIGLLCIFGFYPLTIIWPSGWAWGRGHSHYLMMIIGIYATLGVFLLMASRDPDAHKSITRSTAPFENSLPRGSARRPPYAVPSD